MAIYAGVSEVKAQIPNGTYPAILFQIIQLGSQEFGKNTPKPWYSPQILLGFELPTLKYETQNGEVSSIKSGTYFLSMNPTRNGMVGLREIIDGLRGSIEYTEEQLEEFDISEFLGKECEIVLDGVESKGQTYQNIVGVTPYTGEEKLVGLRKPLIVETKDFKILDLFDLPTWIHDKIMMSKEYKEMEEVSLDHDGIDEHVLRVENDSPFENNAFQKEKEEEIPDDFLKL